MISNCLLVLLLCTVIGSSQATVSSTEEGTLSQHPDALSSPSSRQLQARIVGGDNAKRDEFPYFVQMGLCGGTLIAPGIVQSAAHCRDILTPGTFVTLNPLRVKDTLATRYEIVERIFHPQYDDDWGSYDVSLLRLNEPVYYGQDYDGPVQFTLNEDPNFPPDNVTLTTIGFGMLKEGSNRFPNILQKVELESINLDACNKTMEYEVYDDSFLCAGSQEPNKDSCQGDSGGPLLYMDGNSHILVGSVSWGEGCGDAGVPGVYARTSKAMPWIKHIVCDCWNVPGASFCNGNDLVTTAQASTNTFECPRQIDPNCRDTPGYVDYVGDRCSWHEEKENPGCAEFGDSPGGPGFEDTNALSECCWCGGGSTVEEPLLVLPFERDPECTDLPDWSDQHRDDCEWYEANTEEGTCSGWGGLIGWKGFRDVTAEMACCHCGGGNYPTPAPSPMPSVAPSQSMPPTFVVPTQAPTDPPTAGKNDPSSANGGTSGAIKSCTLVVSLMFYLW